MIGTSADAAHGNVSVLLRCAEQKIKGHDG